MPIDKKYGQQEGLADRLDEAAERLARDKSTQWLGLGLYYDLKAAAAVLRGVPPPAYAPKPEKPVLEFDL